MGISLYSLASEFQNAAQTMSDMEVDQQTVLDTLEGLQFGVEQKAQNVAAFVLNTRAEADAIGTVIDRLQAKKKAYEKRADYLSSYLLENMQRCGISEISANDGTFRIKRHIDRDSAVVIDSASAIPQDYMREVPAKFEPDKTLIQRAINDGFDVPGAHIEKRDRLEIK